LDDIEQAAIQAFNNIRFKEDIQVFRD